MLENKACLRPIVNGVVHSFHRSGKILIVNNPVNYSYKSFCAKLLGFGIKFTCFEALSGRKTGVGEQPSRTAAVGSGSVRGPRSPFLIASFRPSPFAGYWRGPAAFSFHEGFRRDESAAQVKHTSKASNDTTAPISNARSR